MNVVPAPDESLISFISRASLGSDLSWPDFQKEVTGSTFGCARRAERKGFDWERISARLSVSPSNIRELSERRSFATEWSDAKIEAMVSRELPWLATPGYPTYNPVELTACPAFKRTWFKPYSLFDPQSGTLNLRHCHGCGDQLSRRRVSLVQPICSCGTPYAAAPKVQAPDAIVRLSEAVRSTFGSALTDLNVQPTLLVRELNVAWRIAMSFDEVPSLEPIADDFSLLAGMGDLLPGPAPIRWGATEAVDAAVRHAQLLGAALHLVQKHPELVPVIYESVRNGKVPFSPNETIAHELSRLPPK